MNILYIYTEYKKYGAKATNGYVTKISRTMQSETRKESFRTQIVQIIKPVDAHPEEHRKCSEDVLQKADSIRKHLQDADFSI